MNKSLLPIEQFLQLSPCERLSEVTTNGRYTHIRVKEESVNHDLFEYGEHQIEVVSSWDETRKKNVMSDVLLITEEEQKKYPDHVYNYYWYDDGLNPYLVPYDPITGRNL